MCHVITVNGFEKCESDKSPDKNNAETTSDCKSSMFLDTSKSRHCFQNLECVFIVKQKFIFLIKSHIVELRVLLSMIKSLIVNQKYYFHSNLRMFRLRLEDKVEFFRKGHFAKKKDVWKIRVWITGAYWISHSIQLECVK